MSGAETAYQPVVPAAVTNNPVAAEVWEYMQTALPGGVHYDAFNAAVEPAPLVSLGNVNGNDCYIVNEGARPGNAYKIYGSALKILISQAEARARGQEITRVVAASTGNHLTMLAHAARALGVSEVVGMCPKGTVDIKKTNIRNAGVELDDTYETLAGALTAAETLGKVPNTLFIHPYNDPAVIAGQGLIGYWAMERLKSQGIDLNNPQNKGKLWLPGGGGGLGAGNVVSMAVHYPWVEVYVEQQEGCEGVVAGVQGYRLHRIDMSCDGAAVPRPGENPMAILADGRLMPKKHVAAIGKGLVGNTIEWLRRRGIASEPAGAVAPAAMLEYARNNPVKVADDERQVLVAVLSGANMGHGKRIEYDRAALEYNRAQSRDVVRQFQQQSAQHLRRPVYGLSEAVNGPQVQTGGTRVISAHITHRDPTKMDKPKE